MLRKAGDTFPIVILRRMPEPRLTVLGVYRPVISKKTWRKQWRVTGDDNRTRQHFHNLVLIEAIADGLNGSFKMSDFGQMQPEHPNDSRHKQVGYDEGLLSADGETLISRELNCVKGTGPIRFAVYLHLYDPSRPLEWHGGTLICPPMQDIPKRLAMLMPYRAWPPHI
jgi:hypothetical protein